MKPPEIESAARDEAVKRYPDEVAKTLGGVRHGFIEGALWMATQRLMQKQTKH